MDGRLLLTTNPEMEETDDAKEAEEESDGGMGTVEGALCGFPVQIWSLKRGLFRAI